MHSYLVKTMDGEEAVVEAANAGLHGSTLMFYNGEEGSDVVACYASGQWLSFTRLPAPQNRMAA